MVYVPTTYQISPSSCHYYASSYYLCSLTRKETVDMIVCIAEKPSVAKDIARVLGANSSRDGYMEGNGYQVTWTFGHLCTLKEQIGRAHV